MTVTYIYIPQLTDTYIDRFTLKDGSIHRHIDRLTVTYIDRLLRKTDAYLDR